MKEMMKIQNKRIWWINRRSNFLINVRRFIPRWRVGCRSLSVIRYSTRCVLLGDVRVVFVGAGRNETRPVAGNKSTHVQIIVRFVLDHLISQCWTWPSPTAAPHSTVTAGRRLSFPCQSMRGPRPRYRRPILNSLNYSPNYLNILE